MERMYTTGVITASNGLDILNTIRDNANILGWTVEDDRISEDSYVVIKSVGGTKNNDRLPCYVKFRFYSYYILMLVFVYWDSTTHIGHGYTGYSSSTTTSTSCNGVYCDASTYNNVEIKGNLDMFWLEVHRPSTNLRGVCSTVRIDNPTWDYIGEWQTTSGPGSSTTITLRPGDVEKFKVGCSYRIVSPEGHIDIGKVVAKDIGYDQLNLYTTHYTLVSGTRMGSQPFPWVNMGRISNSENAFYINCTTTFSYSDTTTVGIAVLTDRALYGQTYSNDCYNHNDVILQPYVFYDTLGTIGSSSYIQYCNMNPTNYGTVIGINELDVGTTSTVASGSLTDNNKSWVTDVFKDMGVIITNGDLQETMRIIDSNTADTLNITPAYSTTVSGGTSFTVCEAFYVLDNKPDTYLAIKAI